jgi:hypothetical protein
MSMDETNTDREAPERLIQDLRRLYGGELPVPSHVDKSILAAAERRFRYRRRLFPVMRWAAGFAAAACILLAVVLSISPGQPDSEAPAPSQLVAREDFDGSGRVDILDAFALARRIEASDASGLKWDLNGDGMVDRRDVDMIAMAAVRLEKEAIQ